MNKFAVLVLEDGTVFRGISVGYEGCAVGEVVFNTSMTGYQEIISDPSYASQILTLAQPHVGNVGVNKEDEEKEKIYASGLVIKNKPSMHSSWRAEASFQDYLYRKQVVTIADIDTRRLTRHLRSKGTQHGCIRCCDKITDSIIEEAHLKARTGQKIKGIDLAKFVSTNVVYEWSEGSHPFLSKGSHKASISPININSFNGRFHVIAYDFGIKKNILRILVDQGCRVTVVPAETSAEKVLEMDPDGILLSNGPGDPNTCTYAIEAIQVFIEKKIPIFGICLGHQLLGLASGAKTRKMKYGHHGVNHPVQVLKDRKVWITCQNHNFTIDESSLPTNLEITHRSLFDHSIQGIRRLDCPAYSFQGHPEASPGPHDAVNLFQRFMKNIKSQQRDK